MLLIRRIVERLGRRNELFFVTPFTAIDFKLIGVCFLIARVTS